LYYTHVQIIEKNELYTSYSRNMYHVIIKNFITS